jgi:hypothetical protein
MHPIHDRHCHGNTANRQLVAVLPGPRTNLIELNVVPEMRIVVHLAITAIERPLAVFIPAKDVNDSMLYFLCYLSEVHIFAAACGAFHLKVFAIVLMEALQRFYE